MWTIEPVLCEELIKPVNLKLQTTGWRCMRSRLTRGHDPQPTFREMQVIHIHTNIHSKTQCQMNMFVEMEGERREKTHSSLKALSRSVRAIFFTKADQPGLVSVPLSGTPLLCEDNSPPPNMIAALDIKVRVTN